MAVNRRGPRLGVGDIVQERFELLAELGEGGMSRVYEAIDLRYDRPACVKVLSGSLAKDDEFRRRFEREAVAAERVTHPHVLPVWAHGEHEGRLFLVTPLCDGDLGGLLDDHGRLEPDHALALLAQVAWALDWAHARGVVHRDVKPENILLVSGPRDDHAYLGDFGLAKADADASLTQAGSPAGLTPAYAAPEQWLGKPVGPATDQYALAATLYTCLAGHPPFHPRRGPSLQDAHLHAQPPALDALVDDVPGGLARAIARGLAKDPVDRHSSCGELIVAAQSALHGAGGDAAPSVSGGSSSAGLPFAAHTVIESEPSHAGAAAGARAPSVSDRPRAAARPPLRRRALMGAACAAAAALIVIAAVLILARGGGSAGAGAVQLIPVGRDPLSLASGPGGILVANSGDGTLTRIAPRDGVVRQKAIRAVASPFGVAVGDGVAWAVGPSGALAQIDPRTGRRVAVTELGLQADGIAAGFGAVWIINASGGTVTRVDVSTGRVGARRTVEVGRGTTDIAIGPDGPWVINTISADLVRLDGATGRVARRIQLRGAVQGIAIGDGTLWVADPARGRLLRVDPGTKTVIPVAVGPSTTDADVAAGDGAVFYVDRGDGRAARVDPATNRRAGDLVPITGHPAASLVAGHALWVADDHADHVARLRF